MPGPELVDAESALAAAIGVGVPEPLARLNVFRLLLSRPRLARASSDLLLSLLFGAELDARLRELIIMRVAWTTGSAYEWAQHWHIATDAGVSPAELVGVRDWWDHGFDPAAAAVLAAADEVTGQGEAAPETVERLGALLGEDATLEAVATAAVWTMISTLLRSFAVPLEDDLDAWPPDGLGPEDAV
ncbi:MAG: carboxymuconolactone decarboxylase family protein [Acidimicrobiales bacterium]